MTTRQHDPDRLYNLLPALYRIADADHDRQLRAMLALVNEQADAVRADIQQLWDDFFVETCQRWVIPYLGDLVGNNPLHDVDLAGAAATAESIFRDLTGPNLRPPTAIRTRSDVAKTISYRRRKGTPAMLEELARDVTGWGAHVVEFFTLLDWTQHLEHLRPECHGCPDLRGVDAGDRAGGPWDTTTHTVDVRAINGPNGWYNIPNIGFFLWRLEAFPLTNVSPRPIGGTTWRHTFSPLGQDVPLFSSGMRLPAETRLAIESTIAAPIRPTAFFEDLRSAHSPAATSSVFYGDTEADGSLLVHVDGAPIPVQDVECANLDNWTAFTQPAGKIVKIDVARGRLLVPADLDGKPITVSYHTGFSAAMGGGEYNRRKWLVRSPNPIRVSGGGTALATALALPRPDKSTVIEIGDSATYDLTTSITLSPGESLTIQAKESGARPHLRLVGGAISVQTTGAGGSLTLGGLLVEGGISIDGDLETLRLLHSTLVPGRSAEQEAGAAPSGPSLVVAPGPPAAPINTGLQVQIAFSIVGALEIPAHITKLWLLDSIVDGVDVSTGPIGTAIAGPAGAAGPPAQIERSTILGTLHVLKLPLASESIFTETVKVEQRQQGCVRFSYVPPGSETPQIYRCQPALEIALETERRKTAAATSGTALPTGWEATLAAEIEGWLVPGFESERYGDPDFAQLRLTSPIQIRAGAEDGSEMGAFCVLKQPQRESNLLIRLDEYLPVGLEAGIIYVTRDSQSG